MVDQVEIHRMAQSRNAEERRDALNELRNNFTILPNKEQAWNDLHNLTQDIDDDVRWNAAETLGITFPYIANKEQAWNDLHRLTQETNKYVRWGAAGALGVTFPYIPDKEQAWNDLHRLAYVHDIDVRVSANNSLGKACIFKATTAKNQVDFRKELEKGLEFFDKSSKKAQDLSFNPARFCLPFYRSFYTLTFKKEDAETEVRKYIAEARVVCEGSNSREKLLEAIENLSNALKEIERAKDFDELKGDLNAYWRYCDRACELLETMEEKAPGASSLIRKGLPIIDERIKGIIAEIQQKAKAACQKSIGTQAEELVCTANREIQKWHIDNQEQMTWAVENLILSLSTKIRNIPENKQIFDKIKEIKNEGNIIKQYQSLALLIALIPTAVVHRGDVYNVSGVTTSNNSQTIIKGNENTNNPVKSSTSEFEPAKKTWIDVLNSSTTVAAFAGFIAVEIGTYFYPISYNHLISVIAAAISFMVVAMLSRR